MHPAVNGTAVTLSDLARKSVISVCDGSVLGSVCDLEIEIPQGCVTALVLPGPGIFGSLSTKNRVVIPWRNIERIGDDVILVKYFPAETNGREQAAK
ncbi:MAG: YlmC/YmxH family sporulation protein [Clostridia bacterium]|nr:YlmC/YmxH family sporulation protein [Clostridia bacterium]